MKKKFSFVSLFLSCEGYTDFLWLFLRFFDNLSNQNKPSTSILTLFQTKNWVRSMHFINKLLPWNIKCSIITLSKRINLLLATNFGGYCYRSKPHNVYFSRHIFSLSSLTWLIVTEFSVDVKSSNKMKDRWLH